MRRRRRIMLLIIFTCSVVIQVPLRNKKNNYIIVFLFLFFRIKSPFSSKLSKHHFTQTARARELIFFYRMFTPLPPPFP